MTTLQPPNQRELALPEPGRGEASCQDVREVEVVMASDEPESPARAEHLMEAICNPDNIVAALDSVVGNKGAPGVDGITVKQLPGVLKAGRRSKKNCFRGATSRNRYVGCKFRNRPAGSGISVFQLRLTG